MDANKLIMMGYKLKIEHMDYSVYLNNDKNRLIIIKNDKAVFGRDNVWVVSKKDSSYGDFIIIYGTTENMRETVFKIAIDSNGGLIECKDEYKSFWNFFFYETSEVWIAKEENTIYYFDKTQKVKYKLNLYKKSTHKSTGDFYLKRVADGILLLGNTLLNFNTGEVHDMYGTYHLSSDKIVIQEIDDFGFITQVVYCIRLSDGKLFRGHGFIEGSDVCMIEVEHGFETTVATSADLTREYGNLYEIDWLKKI